MTQTFVVCVIAACNLAGDAPSTGDQLVLDLTFTAPTNPLPSSMPEPASLAIVFAGVAGLIGLRLGRRTA